MEYIIAKTAIIRGRVNIGKGSTIQDNVILGSSEDDELEIGENAIIRSGSVIYSKTRIGNNFRGGHSILIRENTEIGDDVLVGTNSVVDGDCRIGKDVSIQTGAYVTRYSVIEDGVFMGPYCITTNDKYMFYGAELKGPVIKEGARIGANATILPGIVIGKGAVVGAGAVVTGNVADGEVVVGNPARRISVSGEPH